MIIYCMVLFAGIAAEALVYGEAEGGDDENMFHSICVLLQLPLSVAQHAHRAAVRALESGGSLSIVIRRIEQAMSSGR
ncbi:hypothetical protein SLEP1_g50871 [Rubroshorea leprosula]|uniref:Uncharacterized protein n=1 Tax=Rubroshorea leprosula TaxID=152421 RepID=A0AAV5M1G8_9ROSI|nr:hypothetical protein SLEP1_g50871 [Rubroshorea leprosula]